MAEADEVARKLGSLEEQEFEDEVCAFLARIIVDFQTVPPYPQGDGGLDGLSHRQSRAYCSYGPKQEPHKKKKGLKDDILKKFRGDMQTICEVETNGRALIHKATPELSTIIVPGRRITAVYLIVSVFDNHQLIGPLNQSFDEYRAASKCNYIDPAATLTIWGPKEIVLHGGVDDTTLYRIEQRLMLKKTREAFSNATPPPHSTSEFDDKFDWIVAQDSSLAGKVQRLREFYKSSWSAAIALEKELANTSPDLHAALLRVSKQAGVEADLAAPAEPLELLRELHSRIADRVTKILRDRMDPELIDHVADGEIAQLIGKCPIDWRKKK